MDARGGGSWREPEDRGERRWAVQEGEGGRSGGPGGAGRGGRGGGGEGQGRAGGPWARLRGRGQPTGRARAGGPRPRPDGRSQFASRRRLARRKTWRWKAPALLGDGSEYKEPFSRPCALPRGSQIQGTGSVTPEPTTVGAAAPFLWFLWINVVPSIYLKRKV